MAGAQVSDERYDLGGTVYLRPLREDDIDDRYIAWFADPRVTEFLDARDISREDAIAHLRHGVDTGTYFMHAICLAEADRHIGNLKIGPIKWRHMTADLVTVIGERDAWGKGYAREAIRIGIKLAFEVHNIRKLSASIDAANVGSIKAYTAAGFEVEASLTDQFMHGETLTDKVYVACFNPGFRAKASGS